MPVSIFLVQAVERAEQVGASWLGYMKVNHRGLNAFMPQKFLDGEDVHAKLEQVCCKTVTQCMKRDPLSQLAFFDGFTQAPLYAPYAQGRTGFLAVEEIVLGTTVFIILAEPIKYQWRKGHVPVFPDSLIPPAACVQV